MKKVLVVLITMFTSFSVLGQEYQTGAGVNKTNDTIPIIYKVNNNGTGGSGVLMISDGDSAAIVSKDGNIGIGTTSPTTTLDVEGGFKLGGDSGVVINTIYPFTLVTPLGNIPAYQDGIRVGTFDVGNSAMGIHSGTTYINMGGGYVPVDEPSATLLSVDETNGTGGFVAVRKNKIDLFTGSGLSPTAKLIIDTSAVFTLTDTVFSGGGGFYVQNHGTTGNTNYNAFSVDMAEHSISNLIGNTFEVRDTNFVSHLSMSMVDTVLRLGTNFGMIDSKTMLSIDGTEDGGIFIGDSVADFAMFRNKGWVQIGQGFSDYQEVRFNVQDEDSSAVLFNITTENIPTVQIGDAGNGYSPDFVVEATTSAIGDMSWTNDSTKLTIGDFTGTVGGFPNTLNGFTLNRFSETNYVYNISANRVAADNTIRAAISALDTVTGNINDFQATSDIAEMRAGNIFTQNYNEVQATFYGIDIILNANDTSRFLVADSNEDAPFVVSQEDSTVTVNNPYTFINQTASYSEMGFGDSLRTIALTQNVEAWVTNSGNDLWDGGAITSSADITTQGDSLTITKDGVYEVALSFSAEGSSGATIELGVWLNGSESCYCTGRQELSNTRVFNVSYQDIIELSDGDVLKPFIVNTATSTDIDAVSGKMIVKRIK